MQAPPPTYFTSYPLAHLSLPSTVEHKVSTGKGGHINSEGIIHLCYTESVVYIWSIVTLIRPVAGIHIAQPKLDNLHIYPMDRLI